MHNRIHDLVIDLAVQCTCTEIIFLSSRFTKNAPPPTFKIGQSIIEPSEVSRNLGVRTHRLFFAHE